MSENSSHFTKPGERDDCYQGPTLARSPDWHLNDDDLSVIDALHATCVEWLAYSNDSKSVRIVAAAMEALEAIAAGRSIDSIVEIDVSRKPVRSDGLSVTLQLSREMIKLSSTEWVWMSPEQGHDHTWTLRAELSPRGGFAYDDVDYWFHLSEFATDGDQTKLLTSQILRRDGANVD